MVKKSTFKMPKKSNSNKRSPKSDDGSSSDSGGSDDEDIQILDKKQYKKFLNNMFPSKYMEKKVKI